MSQLSKADKKRERNAKLLIWLAARASRNQSLLDRLCLWIANRALSRAPEEDFMRDPIVDENEGFDPDELERYQRGESS